MSDRDEKDVVRPHQFDGIQEYENQLPRWWVGMFYLSIVFAGIYIYYYEIDEKGISLQRGYELELAREREMKAAEKGKKPEMSESELEALAQNPDVLKIGQIQFQGKCASCHAADGGGLVGPNLTDDYWIHGRKMSEMVKLITEGVSAKGMPPWGGMMSVEEIQASAAFIRSLNGTKPASPKAPEGNLVK